MVAKILTQKLTQVVDDEKLNGLIEFINRYAPEVGLAITINSKPVWACRKLQTWMGGDVTKFNSTDFVTDSHKLLAETRLQLGQQGFNKYPVQTLTGEIVSMMAYSVAYRMAGQIIRFTATIPETVLPTHLREQPAHDLTHA